MSVFIFFQIKKIVIDEPIANEVMIIPFTSFLQKSPSTFNTSGTLLTHLVGTYKNIPVTLVGC